MTITRVAALLAIALLSLTGCSSGLSDSASSDHAAYSPAVQSDAEGMMLESAGDTAQEVVTTGSLTLVADDVPAAVTKIVVVIEDVAGRVVTRSEQASTEYSPADAWLVVRVPAGKLTDTINSIQELGQVRGISTTSDDVTRAGRDLDARIASLEASTERLLDLMAEAESSEALIAAEGALSDRQADLEALRSERAHLSEQVAMSSLEISVTSNDPVEFKPGGFLGGLKDGWNALIGFASAVLVGFGAVLPWLVVLGVPMGIVIFFLRHRRRRRKQEKLLSV